LRVTAEGNPHPFTIVAADLKAVGAPTPIAFIDRDAAIMAWRRQELFNLGIPEAKCAG
jgi:hypothetical protein